MKGMTKMSKKGRNAIEIPVYSLAEELLNSISHGLGALLGVAALVLCVVRSAMHGDAWAVVASCIYAGSLIILYCMSSIYHALKVNRAKKVFRVLDHCSIFFLIAGTYTPYTLVSLRGPLGWTLFGIIWAVAAAGITFNAIDLKKYKVISLITYVLMGWVIVIAVKPIIASAGINAMRLLLWGGISYTIGAVLYVIGKKKKFIHGIFHIFVVIGSVLHFFSIFLYVI